MRIKLFNKPGVEAILNVRPENPARFRFSLWVAHSLPRGGTEHCGSMHGTLDGVFAELVRELSRRTVG